jgi:HSP20 family protein
LQFQDPADADHVQPVGGTLEADKIAADYSVGVLTLTIPVHEAAKPRSIQVTSSDHKQAVTA